MNKKAFIQGYMDKQAAGEFAKHLEKIVPVGLYAGVPYAAGLAGGALHGNIDAPTSKDLKLLQSEYVKIKMAQALEEMDQIKKRQLLEEQIANAKGTLRI